MVSGRLSVSPALGLFAVWLVCQVASAESPSGWFIHDMERPAPPVVKPAKIALPTPAPEDARVLFDGADLSQWRSADGGPPRWVIRDGYMESVPDSGKLLTADGFGDVQLHVEWASPTNPAGEGQQRGNSGVFLMEKYEIQILDSFNNATYPDGQAASIYGQYPPSVNVCLPPGEWQSYDILFRRPRFDHQGELLKPAKVDVIHNGVWVQVDRELWGPTSWLMNRPYSPHAARLPLALQDHGNPIRFRNIWIRELAESEQSGPSAARGYASIPLEKLSSLAGQYGGGGEEETLFKVTMVDGALWFTAPGRIPLELVASDDGTRDTFYLRQTAGRVVFDRDEQGQGAELSFFLGRREYRSRRMAPLSEGQARAAEADANAARRWPVVQ